MANNPYVNKVVYGGTTLIDISDTTATANTILEGYTAYGADGSKITGTASGQSIIVTDTPDLHGGTIREITGKVVHLQTKTITPASSVQVVNPDTGYDGFSQVTVNAAGAGTIESLTVTPSTSQQVFNSSSVDGYKPVTVAGDANLVASNIVSGVQIFGVTGNVVLQNYYTGSSAPSSSLGSNGDLYLQS